MRKQRHFRLFDLNSKKVILQVYIHRGQGVLESFYEASDEFGIILGGSYRIDRMILTRGRLTWLHGTEVKISQLGG